jgi:type IV secretion system protein VirB9
MEVVTGGRFIVAALMLAATVQAETVPVAGVVDSRIRTTAYDANEVYRLVGRVGYQLEIEFETGERFVGLGAGDLRALTFVAEGNRLFLKPKAAHVDTNLTIITSARSYRFAYVAAPRLLGGDDSDVIYLLRFTYPQIVGTGRDRNAGEGPVAAPDTVGKRLSAAAETAPRNLDYWFCGHPSLKPVEASDDGMRTRLRFAPRAELPAVFVRNDDGSESLVNFSIEQGDVIVHRLARRLVLRRGTLTGCVVNAAYSGSGQRAASQTISPEVKRATQGVEP